jgi:predicted  nucleic acid-binding Zn-ribbon protein
MPHDNHRVFADWTAEQMKTVLPAGVVAEYVKDGKPAAQGDPAPRLSNGNYVRALRDYRTLFHADRVNWTEMLDLFQATTLDKALVDSALADAKRQEEADKQHVAEAKEKLGKYTREYDIVEAHRKTLERQLAVVTAEVAKLLEANKATADQLARSQWDAVHHIDQRVRDMVQSNAGGK